MFPLQKLRDFQPGVCQGDVSCLYIKPADLLCKAAISSIFFGRSEQKPMRFRLALLVLSRALGGMSFADLSRSFHRKVLFFQRVLTPKGEYMSHSYIFCILV